MQYGGRGGGYSENQRLPGLSSRGGERGRTGALPDILWRASGVTTRPGSGLRLSVRHMDVPHHTTQHVIPPISQQVTQSRLSRSEPIGKPLQYFPSASQRRHSLRDTPRLLSRPQLANILSSSSSSSSKTPKANRAMLPPLLPQEKEEREEEEETSTTVDKDSSSLEDSEEEICSEEEEEEEDTSPPSRPGFESETDQTSLIFDVPFPAISKPRSPFPATLLQDHLQQGMERYSAAVLPSGLCPRVNNIVRAFSVHGPVNREMLGRALNSVASLHPILCASFQRLNDKLYIQIPLPGPVTVPLDSPVVMGHEKVDNLITNARRKPFHIPLRNDLVAIDNKDEGSKVLSIVSVVSDDSGGKSPKQSPPPQVKKSVTFVEVSGSSKERTVSISTQQLEQRSFIRDREKKKKKKDEVEREGEERERTVLMRARYVQESVRETILVLSFPRIICDFWSSSLFVKQLAEAYGQLERSSGVSRRIEASRREVATKYGYRQSSRHKQPVRDMRAEPVERDRGGGGERYRPTVVARISFQTVALRERQLLKFVSRERHWSFWEGILTAIIKRQRGPNRVKVVPPVRIPSGLGEKVARVPRPQTSRLRPLTGRARPQTGRRGGEPAGGTRDSLTGPKTEFHFIKFEEEVCMKVREAVMEEMKEKGEEDQVLCLVCLGVYVLLLGRCCRGWGEEEKREGGGGGGGEKFCPSSTKPTRDPLQQYHTRRVPPAKQLTINLPSSSSFSPSSSPRQRSRRARMGGRLDLGSFLVGVEVSMRQSHPSQTQGLFAPLTTDVGIRVNLSSSETFLDLVLALGKTLQSVRHHHHFPFSTVTDELGIPPCLPVRFSYLYHSDIIQLSDPTHFYFPETAIGVKGHGLARFGSTCYLSPLSTKLDDSRHLEVLAGQLRVELCLWEGYDSGGVGGVLLYQPRVLQRQLVEGLATELTKLMTAVATEPSVSLSHLSFLLSPPFSHSKTHRTGHH